MSRRDRGLQDAVAARLDEVPWVHRSGPYQALDLRFGVRTCDPALGEYLAATFAAFAEDGSTDGACWFSALERGDGVPRRLLAYLAGRRIVATTAPTQVLAYLLWAFNQAVTATARGALLIHAAAAERDGAVVVLPAAQESGKTTLVAGLLRRGYRYVTDEAFAVGITTGRLRPFPKALSLDVSSWRLFPELAPELAPPQRAYMSAQWHIPAARLGAETVGPEATPRVVLSPRYQPGATTALTRLRPAAGLLLLAENSFNAADWGQAGLCAAADMLRGCPVIGKLIVGDLDSACDVVDQAVDEALAWTEQASNRAQRGGQLERAPHAG